MNRIVSLTTLMIPCLLATAILLAEDAPKPKSETPASSQASAPAGSDAPRTITGSIKDLPADGGKPVSVMGHQGCLVIRTPQRSEMVWQRFREAGWKANDAALRLNYADSMAVLVFNFGDAADKFSCREYSGDKDKATLDLAVSYVPQPRGEKPVRNFNFVFVIVPRSAQIEVRISTSNAQTDQPARLEWKAQFGPDSGDIVDGLRGTISCDEKAVVAGRDIPVVFKLELVNPAVVKDGYFAKAVDKVFVWDGKYSKGYRNYAFMVTTPDGKTRLLQPNQVDDWDKNAPHPVEVTADKPYVLPTWAGQGTKSLTEIGLDTSLPGKYTIQGIYAETGQETQWDNKPVPMWGAEIATNTIGVQVTKAASR